MPPFEDLTGKKFDMFNVLKRVEDYDGKSDLRTQWLVECEECGNREKVVGRSLKRRSKKYCCKCQHNKSRFNHDGRVAYWGSNAYLFKEEKKDETSRI